MNIVSASFPRPSAATAGARSEWLLIRGLTHVDAKLLSSHLVATAAIIIVAVVIVIIVDILACAMSIVNSTTLFRYQVSLLSAD